MLGVTVSVDRGTPLEHPIVAQLIEVGSCKLKQTIEVPTSWRYALTLAFSPNGELLAIGGRKEFGLFSIRTGRIVAQETHVTSKSFWTETELVFDLSDIEFSPQGGMLITGGNDGKVKLWKVEET